MGQAGAAIAERPRITQVNIILWVVDNENVFGGFLQISESHGAVLNLHLDPIMAGFPLPH